MIVADMETSGEVSYYSGADRLSLLPDEILHHILSLFPETKEIARTSVLSARFRRLWQHHPTIRFVSVPRSNERYLSSVRRCLLSLRSPTLQTLDLCLLSYFPFCTQSATQWVQFGASRSVRCLRLTFSSRVSMKIPAAAVYSCRMLTSLVLHERIPIFPGSFAGFPFLLHLKIMGPISSKTLARLLSKCPSLRSLDLSYCDSLGSLDISFGTLSVVSITYCRDLQSARLDVPNLASITFFGELDTLGIENACHLLDASMRPSSMAPGGPLRMIQDLRHVSRRLEMDDWFFGPGLPMSPLNPTFKNLKELHCCFRRFVTAPMLRGLVSVLQHCPNLEHLYLSLKGRMCDYQERIVDKLSGFFSLLDEYQRELAHDRGRQVWEAMEGFKGHSRLKFVVVECFLGTANEIKMLEYLLSRGSALEKLSIHDCLQRSKEEIHQLLAHIPRASPQLQILLMDY